MSKFRFVNWARNQRCSPSHYYRPQTQDQLREIVLKHARVRTVGSAHSWSPLCLCDEALVNMDGYNRPLGYDAERGSVRVQAGMKLWQLNDWLDKQGLALANLGSIDRQSVAGAIATGTHGTGKGFRILADQLRAFTLLPADGSRLHIDRQLDPELFRLAAVHLGCLGLVTELELDVVPAFRLHERSYTLPFEAALDDLDELLDTTDHLKFWWFAPTERLIVYRYRRTDEPANDSRLRQWFMDEFVSVAMYRLLVGIGNLNRNWRPTINRLLTGFIRPLDRIEKSYRVFRVPKPPRHRETEWALDLRRAADALREYRDRLKSGPHRLNFLQEFRFTRGDDFALSPCYGRDSFWLSGYNIDPRGWEAFRSDVQALAIRYEGRPHWGKEFVPDAEYLQRCYPRLPEFLALRQRLDPEGKFLNPWLEQTLGIKP